MKNSEYRRAKLRAKSWMKTRFTEKVGGYAVAYRLVKKILAMKK